MEKNKLNNYFIAGSVCFLAVILNHQFSILSLLFGAEIEALFSGALTGLGLLFEFEGFYNNTHDVPFMQRKKSPVFKKVKMQK